VNKPNALAELRPGGADGSFVALRVAAREALLLVVRVLPLLRRR
jgi:hypothetical protein